MDESLITKAKEIARQQKIINKISRENHLKEIYNEAIRLLEESILNKRIYNGCIKIRTRNSFINSHGISFDKFRGGYCGWDYDKIYVWGSEGIKVSEMIRNDYLIDCKYYDEGCSDDSYFEFNFNDE